MEYQFSYDVLGQPVAKCELECEAFGDWLSHDIAKDHKQLSLLLEVIKKLQKQQLADYQYIGKIYHLQLDKDEVTLTLNNETLDLAQAQHVEWDPEISNGCGLIDLQRLLIAWQAFTLNINLP